MLQYWWECYHGQEHVPNLYELDLLIVQDQIEVRHAGSPLSAVTADEQKIQTEANKDKNTIRNEGNTALITSLKLLTLLVMPLHIMWLNGFMGFGAKRGAGELGDWVIPLTLLWLLENWWKIVFCENLPTLTVAAVSTVILSMTAEKSCIQERRWKRKSL